jgi:hypothetical protein
VGYELLCYPYISFVAGAAFTLGHLLTPTKKMKKLIGLALLAAVLTGCAVYTPSGSVVVDPGHGGGHGGFCPPGQAKKGNC